MWEKISRSRKAVRDSMAEPCIELVLLALAADLGTVGDLDMVHEVRRNLIT
jgi:hypothetical protein